MGYEGGLKTLMTKDNPQLPDDFGSCGALIFAHRIFWPRKINGSLKRLHFFEFLDEFFRAIL